MATRSFPNPLRSFLHTCFLWLTRAPRHQLLHGLHWEGAVLAAFSSTGPFCSIDPNTPFADSSTAQTLLGPRMDKDLESQQMLEICPTKITHIISRATSYLFPLEPKLDRHHLEGHPTDNLSTSVAT